MKDTSQQIFSHKDILKKSIYYIVIYVRGRTKQKHQEYRRYEKSYKTILS